MEYYKNNEFEAKYHLDINNDFYIYGSNTHYSMGDGNTSKNLDFLYREFVYGDVMSYSFGYFHCVFKTSNNDLFFIGNTEITKMSVAIPDLPYGQKFSNGCRKIAENVDDFFATNYGVVFSTIGGDVIEIGVNAAGYKGRTYHDYTKQLITPFTRIDFISAGGDGKNYGIPDTQGAEINFFRENLKISKVSITPTDIFFLTDDKKLYFLGNTPFKANNCRSGKGLIDTEIDDIRFEPNINTIYMFRGNQMFSRELGVKTC